MEPNYYDYPHLMTAEECEEMDVIADFPDFIRDQLFTMCATPDEEGKQDFLRQRRPALGFTSDQLDAILQFHASAVPVQQRKFVRHIRHNMLRFFISPNNAVTMKEHVDMLRNTTTLPPLPPWYKFSKVAFGPRRLGLMECSNRTCAKAEVCDEAPFKYCSRCKSVYYCSQDCQREDWRARHKVVCSKTSEDRDKMADVGRMLQMFRDQHR